MSDRPATEHGLALRSLILVGLIAAGFALLAERGLLGAGLVSDRSYLSWVILILYLAASVHWLLLTVRLSRERDRLSRLERSCAAGSCVGLEALDHGVRCGDQRWPSGYLAAYLRGLLLKRDAEPQPPDAGVLAVTLGDEIANRHAAGHFVSDTLLKLGLLGTMVGFILMLMPVADMHGFEASLARQLLREMSGGMAVALYTTLAGIVTSTLLKLQYQVLDTSAQDFLNRLTVLTDVYLLRPSSNSRDA